MKKFTKLYIYIGVFITFFSVCFAAPQLYPSDGYSSAELAGIDSVVNIQDKNNSQDNVSLYYRVNMDVYFEEGKFNFDKIVPSSAWIFISNPTINENKVSFSLKPAAGNSSSTSTTPAFTAKFKSKKLGTAYESTVDYHAEIYMNSDKETRISADSGVKYSITPGNATPTKSIAPTTLSIQKTLNPQTTNTENTGTPGPTKFTLQETSPAGIDKTETILTTVISSTSSTKDTFKNDNGSKPIYIICLILLTAFICAGSFYFYKKKKRVGNGKGDKTS